jgi:hypothetical protein
MQEDISKLEKSLFVCLFFVIYQYGKGALENKPQILT